MPLVTTHSTPPVRLHLRRSRRRPAGRPDSRLAAQPPHVGEPGRRPARGRVPGHRLRPARLRRVGAPADRATSYDTFADDLHDAGHARSTCTTSPWSASRWAAARWPATSARTAATGSRRRCSSAPSRRSCSRPPTTRGCTSSAVRRDDGRRPPTASRSWRLLPRTSSTTSPATDVRADTIAVREVDRLRPRPSARYECIRPSAPPTSAPTWRRSRCPTLVLHGSADRIVPFEVSGKLTAAAIPGSTLVVLDGAPHGMTATHGRRSRQRWWNSRSVKAHGDRTSCCNAELLGCSATQLPNCKLPDSEGGEEMRQNCDCV